MSEKEEMQRLEQYLVDTLAEVFKGLPQTPEQMAKGLEDLLNAKSKALVEGREYVLTGIDGKIAYFDVKQAEEGV